MIGSWYGYLVPKGCNSFQNHLTCSGLVVWSQRSAFLKLMEPRTCGRLSRPAIVHRKPGNPGAGCLKTNTNRVPAILESHFFVTPCVLKYFHKVTFFWDTLYVLRPRSSALRISLVLGSRQWQAGSSRPPTLYSSSASSSPNTINIFALSSPQQPHSIHAIIHNNYYTVKIMIIFMSPCYEYQAMTCLTPRTTHPPTSHISVCG